MLKELISLKNISRFYNNRKIRALNNITLSVSQGEFVSITGPSGSGKSTLLNIMSGLDRPDDGEIFFNDRKIDNTDKWVDIRSKNIGFVFQKFNLLPTFTALENVEIPMFGVVDSARERQRKATELLGLMGLEDRLHHYQSELSGGEQQRVAIARSLANSPDIIFADEPTGNLDSKNSEAIISLLQDIHLKFNRTLVIVTHDEEIARISNRKINIFDGKIVNESFKK